MSALVMISVNGYIPGLVTRKAKNPYRCKDFCSKIIFP